ncbi:unnamed protein product, partial [marine sediment metagenome]
TMLGSYAEQGYEPAWVVDVAPLAGNRVLAVGRHNRNYPATDDAWFKASGQRGMFLKVLTADMEELFSAHVPDAVPYALARRCERCVIVGMAESGASPIKVPLFGEYAGGLDAYLMVVDLPR